MKWAPRLALFAKGICMGLADVIPGVSGGTMALILGIYREFIDAIRSINPRPILPFFRWVFSGFDRELRRELDEALSTIHLGFLLPLVCGIAIAIGVGSVVIPSLLESYPELMRGLFFGLIVASVYTPFKMMPKDDGLAMIIAVLVGGIAGFGGYLVTDPNTLVDTTSEWVEVVVPETDEPLTLKEAIRRGPSSLTADKVYWAEENAPLRATIERAAPGQAAELAEMHEAATSAVATDKHAAKERAVPYNELVVPAGATIQVPRPSFAFIFMAGAVAICAMVLPGISGSFILLILGCYYFVLNALKGSLRQLLGGEFPAETLLYLVLFITGLAVGILSFSRVLSWLLKRFPAPTMGALIGLMLGCLRGIWPYQRVADGALVNVVPATWGTMELGAVGAALVGVAVVVAMTVVGERLEARQEEA